MQDNHTQINLNPWIISETCSPQTQHLPFSHIACDLGNITIIIAGILSAYHVPGIFPQLSQLNSISTHSHPMRRVMIIFIVKGGELHTQDLLTLSPSSVKGLRLDGTGIHRHLVQWIVLLISLSVLKAFHALLLEGRGRNFSLHHIISIWQSSYSWTESPVKTP